jgi:hypothetical protein
MDQDTIDAVVKTLSETVYHASADIECTVGSCNLVIKIVEGKKFYGKVNSQVVGEGMFLVMCTRISLIGCIMTR